MECPPNKERNPKTGRCVKKCPPGKERDKTGRCVRLVQDIMTQRLRREFDQILAQLRRPRLADVFETSNVDDPVACLRKVATQDLESQIQRRRRPVNVLVPRKKKK